MAPVVIYASLKELLPCPYNRATDDRKIELIQREILRTKTVKPLVVTEIMTDDGPRLMVTDGHHRRAALVEMVETGILPKEVKVAVIMATEDGVESGRTARAEAVRNNARPPQELGTEVALKPIFDKDSYHVQVAKTLEDAFNRALYDPLLLMIRDARRARYNSKASLLRAIETGKIAYSGGILTGEFSAEISKYLRTLGAKWDQGQKGYMVTWAALPEAVKIEIAESRKTVLDLQKRIDKHLKQIGETPSLVNFELNDEFNVILNDLEKQFKKTTEATISVVPNVSEAMKRQLAEQYVNNLDLYVTNWADEAVVRMRKIVQKASLQGVRAEGLEAMILAEKGVTRRKAKFLARQETSLMVSKFRELRYSEAGLTQYKWSTSGDERVRKSHKDLNGRLFAFSSPPVTDYATGERNNPGEDFNCRCVAIPVFRSRGSK